MATENSVTYLIEYLREKMVRLAESTGDLGNSGVIQVSQQLDLYLLQMQLMASKTEIHNQQSVDDSIDVLVQDVFSAEESDFKFPNTAIRA